MELAQALTWLFSYDALRTDRVIMRRRSHMSPSSV